MPISEQDVQKALGELEEKLPVDEKVEKASNQDLDQPEGSDLDAGHMKNKMSDEAGKPKKSKKAKKSEDGEDDVSKAGFPPKKDKEEKEEDEEGEEMEKEEKSCKKSFSDELPDEVTTKIEVSEFLRSLVDHTGGAIDGLREDVSKSEEVLGERYDTVSEALQEIQESQAKVGVVLKAICERIGVIENSPAAPPKSETDVAKSGQPAERNFTTPGAPPEGQTDEPVFKSLSPNPVIAKSQLANALCDLVKKGEAKDMDVISFEGSGHIAPEVFTKLRAVLN